MPTSDAAAQRATLTDEVILAHELVQVSRAHPGSKRLSLGRWLEERFRASTKRAPCGRHRPMVALPVAGPGADELERDSRCLGDDPEPDQQGNQGTANHCHASHVARDVGVFVTGRDRQR